MDEDIPNNLLEEEIPFTSNLTNYTEQSLQLVNAMRTAFVEHSPSTTGETERVTTHSSRHEHVRNGGSFGSGVHKTFITKNRRSGHTVHGRTMGTWKCHH